MAIAAPEGTDAAALKLVADLSGLLGASPLFCDMAELDGFSASTHLLPKLLSAALLNTTLGQPGWKDAGKFAGVEYAAVSSGITGSEEIASIREAVILNKDNVLRSLDGLLTALYALRDDIEDDRSIQLGSKLDGARVGRQKWWLDRQNMRTANNEKQAVEMPKTGDFWKQQFGFLSRLSESRPPKPDKKD
jgi:prephenate dehydrogenase